VRAITRQTGVRAGEAIIEGTRIGVHDMIGLLQNRETVDGIPMTCFPGLTKAQIYECLAYYEQWLCRAEAYRSRWLRPPHVLGGTDEGFLWA
jgi:uncharacterized protein (DUF433 family)